MSVFYIIREIYFEGGSLYTSNSETAQGRCQGLALNLNFPKRKSQCENSSCKNRVFMGKASFQPELLHRHGSQRDEGDNKHF